MAKAKKDPAEPGCLTYTGDGEHYVLGVPATDLHDVEPAEAERLIDTGLYKAMGSCNHAELAAELAKEQPPAEAADDAASPSEPDQPDSGDTTGDDS